MSSGAPLEAGAKNTVGLDKKEAQIDEDIKADLRKVRYKWQPVRLCNSLLFYLRWYFLGRAGESQLGQACKKIIFLP